MREVVGRDRLILVLLRLVFPFQLVEKAEYVDNHPETALLQPVHKFDGAIFLSNLVSATFLTVALTFPVSVLNSCGTCCPGWLMFPHCTKRRDLCCTLTWTLAMRS